MPIAAAGPDKLLGSGVRPRTVVSPGRLAVYSSTSLADMQCFRQRPSFKVAGVIRRSVQLEVDTLTQHSVALRARFRT